ncbi:MAG: hypothetical protein JXA90_04585, partial [Planctomycetes bacterium]|nr:hypothetical protein [Planctomycetota bacterium]
RVRFRDPGGITASAQVIDEQGKININTAPPNLIAGVFGVRQLIQPLKLADTEMLLDDTTPFPGDSDPATIDGAVVIVHRRTQEIEAVTYRRKAPNALLDCFRADFLSYSGVDEFPAESLVYDLRGWKIAYHRIWSSRYGGFHAPEPTEFPSVEAMRDIARWQMASLFVSRFRGEGLTLDLLRDSGISTHQLEKYGLDRVLFTGEDRVLSEEESRRYRLSLERLQRLRVSRGLLKKIEQRRGPQVIVDLAARLEGAGRAEVRKVVEEIEAALGADQRSAARLDRKYLSRALVQLGKSYEVDGLETILPEDLENHRDAFTVSSRVAARWSEPQAILTDISSASARYDTQLERPSEFNPGTLVRIRPKRDDSPPELNFVKAAGGARVGGVELSFPLLRSYRAFGATIQALQRHPVNVNTAPRKVLAAVFTGIQGPDQRHIVTPYEADRLALEVIAARPLRSYADFRSALQSAAGSESIDEEDVDPLFTNAVQPTHYSLRLSTTGLCFSTADVYTIESRGILRSPAGREVAQARFREIVEVSPPGSLFSGLLTQRDFSQGFYLRDPRMGIGFPEYDHQFLLQFPGARSHLVESRPLMIRRGPLIEPQGDLGSLRLAVSSTPDGWPGTFRGGGDPIEHFEDRWDGFDLAHGEPYSVEIAIGGAAAGVGRGGASAGGGSLDLTTVPGGIEFWFRMRTYPAARSEDGFLKLVEGGSDPERNHLALLYDPSAARVILRIRDASLPDPSVITNRETGQYLQIEAQRPLDLHTWYHIRIAWDGVFGGGAQLYIDGIPAGEDNLSTELLSSIPATAAVSAINVRDASKFPIEGVVRIDAELFEYRRSGRNALTVRRQTPSTWVQQMQQQQILDAIQAPARGAGGSSRPGGWPGGGQRPPVPGGPELPPLPPLPIPPVPQIPRLPRGKEKITPPEFIQEGSAADGETTAAADVSPQVAPERKEVARPGGRAAPPAEGFSGGRRGGAEVGPGG